MSEELRQLLFDLGVSAHQMGLPHQQMFESKLAQEAFDEGYAYSYEMMAMADGRDLEVEPWVI